MSNLQAKFEHPKPMPLFSLTCPLELKSNKKWFLLKYGKKYEKSIQLTSDIKNVSECELTTEASILLDNASNGIRSIASQDSELIIRRTARSIQHTARTSNLEHRFANFIMHSVIRATTETGVALTHRANHVAWWRFNFHLETATGTNTNAATSAYTALEITTKSHDSLHKSNILSSRPFNATKRSKTHQVGFVIDIDFKASQILAAHSHACIRVFNIVVNLMARSVSDHVLVVSFKARECCDSTKKRND